MTQAPANLPDDIAALKAMELARDAELRVRDLIISDRQLIAVAINKRGRSSGINW